MRLPAWRPALLSLGLLSTPALAHKPSDSLLQLSVQQAHIEGDWAIHLRDLDDAIGLDSDGNGAITWGELKARRTAVETYAAAHLQLAADGQRCVLRFGELGTEQLSDGGYAVLAVSADCPAPPQTLRIDYSLLFALDATHRGLLKLAFGGTQTAVFSPEHPQLDFHAAQTERGRVFAQYFREGLRHVWRGLDHLLFLAGLFLPAVLVRRRDGWQPVARLRTAVWDSARLVTAFTLAHATTLTLAATGLFVPPSRLVESLVAASVAFAGLNNWRPMVERRLIWLAAGFGLVHGAAVAGALVELGLPPGARAWALLAFNLGVEAAQLTVLALVLPPSYALRHSPLYRRAMVLPGSALIALIGLYWLVDRAFALNWPFLKA